ncbi:MAG: quaternary ammonium transporter [Candidatus Eremiobacteraeota bacterium]|nr:quaternary ammonium transporter [Candidatus Eremiobacteraeota bacterium]MBV8284833.1 quaternary ammonium transporter [Candidatus Eremiobacteraeota bacterium]MBV8654658.1 quaternary ammonium transporter [Candidatus Eremiobacteraeota bacterium]
MSLARSRAIALIAASPLLARCGSKNGSVRVGSKNFTESFVLAEIYAQALEAAGLRVDRRFNLGSTQIALAAMARGDIDLYPEYTGTALIDVLHLPPEQDPKAVYATVAREFGRQYDLTWLRPSPMNDSQALATTKAIAARERIATLSDLAPKAGALRLATIQEFLSRPDGLSVLQRVYGGFRFADVKTYDIALKYQALTSGKADVASAFTTDGAIATDELVVLRDDKRAWAPYNVAPVVRTATLKTYPSVARLLDAVSPRITDAAAQRMNAAVESGHRDPADVAAEFLAGKTG